MDTVDRPWFKRGRAGLGYRPQTWQAWACIAAFLIFLGGSVELAQAAMGYSPQAQGVAFIVAAAEIMGFMKFIRRRTEAAPDTTVKK